MLYRKHGKSGVELSIVGFGGMRFKDIDNSDLCIEMMVEAAESGINYFDTAPLYFEKKGEEIFGEGFAELKNRKLPFYSSTKTFASKESAIRNELEAQLKRMNLDHIDFYHMWNVSTLEKWQMRKDDSIIKTFIKLKEEGLIKNICVSSHLIGDQIQELLKENIFDAVLFGYSAYNFTVRQAAFDIIKKYDIGCVVMNPLGGGIIPQHPQIFEHLKTYKNQPIVEAALHFIFAQNRITTALVGFSTVDEVHQAVKAAENYKVIPNSKMDEIKENVRDSFNDLCTGCQYCDNCPVDIPIPKYMDAYNHKKLYKDGDKQLLDRLKMHWFIPTDLAALCTECGQCEDICTQHLPIISRLKEIANLKK
jgi:predicted aldo/keto reductase-like oxidoreductase